MKKRALLFAFFAAVSCRAGGPLPGAMTPRMMLRYMPHGGGGERGVIVQGPLADTAGKADLVRFSRGEQISGNWYRNFDANQGWILFWVKPEWDGSDAKEHCFLQWSPNGYIKKNEANELVFSTAAGVSVSTNISNWTAGRTYRIDAFWNAYNPVTGAYYLALGVNQTNVYGRTSAYTVETPAEFIHIGSSLETNRAANALIGTLTIFRRFDPTAVFAFQTGSGQNICSWDTVFGMPTARGIVNATWEFVGGAAHAYTHPYTNSNLLPGNSRMGGYMLAGAYATDGWSLEGAPTVAAMTAAQRIFRGGYQATSTAVNQGLYQDVSVAPGTNLVMRVVAHSDGVAIPRAIFHNQSAGTVLGQLTGRATSTRLDPDVLILTCQAPAGCNTIRVKLVNTQGSGTVYWHQAEVLLNAMRNPSVETGAVNTNGMWVPTQWGCSFVPPGVATQETVHVHSGSSAIRVDKGVWNYAGFFSYMVYCDGLSSPFNSAGWFGCSAPLDGVTSPNFHSDCGTTWWEIGYWTPLWKIDLASNYLHHAFISYPRSSFAIMRISTWGGRAYTDDVYAFPLPTTPVTVTAASTADSREGQYGMRVDGFDRFVGGYDRLGPSSGSLAWQYTPRHSGSCAVEFGVSPAIVEIPGGTNAQAYVLTAWGNSDNFIRLYWVTNDVMRLRYRMNGAEAFGDWRGTGIEAGKNYRMQLSYRGGGNMTLHAQAENCAPSFAPAINLSGIPSAFAVAPTNVYWGARWDGTNATYQGDAVFAPWTPGTVIRIF